jgi:hypothetical protein
MWALPQSEQMYFRWVFFVGLSPPGTFENLPAFPIVALPRRVCRAFHFIPVDRPVRTFSTSCSWCPSQFGQYVLNRRGISIDIDLVRFSIWPVKTRLVRIDARAARQTASEGWSCETTTSGRGGKIRRDPRWLLPDARSAAEASPKRLSPD